MNKKIIINRLFKEPNPEDSFRSSIENKNTSFKHLPTENTEPSFHEDATSFFDAFSEKVTVQYRPVENRVRPSVKRCLLKELKELADKKSPNGDLDEFSFSHGVIQQEEKKEKGAIKK